MDLDLSTQLEAKFFILFLSIAEKGPGAHGLGSVHTAGSKVFLFLSIAEKGPSVHGLGSVHTAGSQALLILSIAEKGPGAWDQDLSTQLAAKLLMIDSNAGQLPHPDR